MKTDRIIMLVFTAFMATAVVVGIVLVFKPAPAKKPAKEAGGEEKKRFGGLFEALGPAKEGIAVVKVYGVIETETTESMFGVPTGGADYVVKKIERFRKNKLVKGIILRVNSPGGTVAASQEILAAIKQAKKDGKKIFVSMGDLAASGGYYIACHADRIYADPGTLTGSIGVLIGNLNLTELAKKIGVNMNYIKSGEHKDILSPWRDMSEEEKQLLQETVMDVYEQFVEEVSTGRSIPIDQVKPLADGRIFTGRQAKELKLVDEIGGFQDALKDLAKLVGLKGGPVVIKDYENMWDDMMERFDTSAEKKVGLMDVLTSKQGTSDYVPVTYLYNGGR
ncbi:MAG: signal peptide peptidase SppA [Pseudomonadota bacterium]